LIVAGGGPGGVAIEGDLGWHRATRGGVGELVLMQKEEGARLQEGGSWNLHRDEGHDVGEVRVQTPEVGEDQGLVCHGLPHISECVGEGLQVVAVGGDGEIALDDGLELRLEVDDAGELVIEEEVLDQCVSVVHGLVLSHDGVEDFVAVVTQHTTACCSMQVVDITLMKYHFTNITPLRVVQQKHSGLYSST
jgi:hypothetical protein